MAPRIPTCTSADQYPSSWKSIAWMHIQDTLVYISSSELEKSGRYGSVSAGVLLFRVAKARGYFLGKVKIHSVIGDHLLDDKVHDHAAELSKIYDEDVATRNVFLPLNHHDGSNPSLQVETPYPGIFIYRFSEGFNYPNANHYTDNLVQGIFATLEVSSNARNVFVVEHSRSLDRDDFLEKTPVERLHRPVDRDAEHLFRHRV